MSFEGTLSKQRLLKKGSPRRSKPKHTFL